MAKTPFITIEGGEGAGKSTQIRLLRDWLGEQGITTVATREPGGTSGAEAIRDLIVQPRETQWDVETDSLLLMAARRDHLVHVIWPALERGQWVLSDRFVDSTYAYQCYGRGLPIERARELYRFIAGDFMPDVTFFLDIEPQKGLERVLAAAPDRNMAEMRFENYDRSFHEKLRQGFHDLAASEQDRFVVLDADTGRDHLQQQLREEIMHRFGGLLAPQARAAGVGEGA